MELRFAVVVVFFIFAAFCIHTSHSQGMQQFDREPQYTEANPGEIVIMPCRVFNKKGQCVWQKDGKPVGIYPGKYEWVSSPDLGDCSLRISAARADLDAGEWECQVTASSFDAQDALTSDPARLVVRVPPSPPQLEVELSPIADGGNLTLSAGKEATVRCLSRGGNPAANVKWFLDDRELVGQYNQTNTTDIGKVKTWMAVSTLTYTFNKTDHSKLLRCVALHEAYPTKSRESSVTLDIHYAPEVTLVGTPTVDLEENIDSVSLRCRADANPPATVIWRRVGGNPSLSNKSPVASMGDIYSFQEILEFSPVTRKDSATYSCEAKNTIGTSNLITIPIDIKYSPMIVNVGPAVSQQLTVTLYESTRLECQAEGNPQPRYQWLHRRPKDGEEDIVIRSEDRYLHITNVTYEHQGEYICIATSTINGLERMVQSEAITLRVVGPPQVLNEVSSRFISVERGDDAVIRAVFCADPRPIRVSWRWAAFQMEAGSGSGRFVAEALHKVSPAILPTPPAIVELVGEDEDDEDDVMGNTESSNTNSAYDTAIIENTSTSSTMHHPRSLEVVPTAQSLVARPPQAVFTYPGKRDECYETRLRIQRVEMNDARHYYLTVENDKGSDTFYVTLTVKEPVSMATVIAVVIACLFLIIVVTLCLLYAYRSERCCFDRKGGSKSTDLESMKSDVESVHSSSQCSSSGNNSATSQTSINRGGTQRSSSIGQTKCHVSNSVTKIQTTSSSSSSNSSNLSDASPSSKKLNITTSALPGGGQFKTNIFINGPTATTTTSSLPPTTTTTTTTTITTNPFSALNGESIGNGGIGFPGSALRGPAVAKNQQ
ncbi:kin of IRRE-like protein 1 isoform X2 [Daphnia pulex]|uniref:kin of IRRE-like protein 1 isoform X2 n=1 Tax=Daphnia pulex TaxID=6669 RepID=UPI001EE0B18F|nr:kin of IRRE-like protein 1 isoform X2 [Daphnia pulex]XP_046633125.1 kin of IRRE-like protein 1 isoform X2 [Daphnia pulicaria]